jgi:hypothetical protein
VNLHVSIIEEEIKELKEQNEMLKDQLALPLLTPLANEVNEVKHEEEQYLKYYFIPEVKIESEMMVAENSGYAFTARTY